MPDVAPSANRSASTVDGTWERVPVDVPATVQAEPAERITVDAVLEPSPAPLNPVEEPPYEIPPCPLDAKVLTDAGLEEQVAAEVFATATLAWRLHQVSLRAKVDNPSQRGLALLFVAWPDLGKLVSSKKMNVRVIVQRNPNILGSGSVCFSMTPGGQGHPREATATFHCPSCFVTFEFNDANAPAEEFAALFRD